MMELKRRISTFAVALLLWGGPAVADVVPQVDSTDRAARVNVTSKGKIVTPKTFNLVTAALDPGTLLLLGVGMAGVGVWARKRVRKRNNPR